MLDNIERFNKIAPVGSEIVAIKQTHNVKTHVRDKIGVELFVYGCALYL